MILSLLGYVHVMSLALWFGGLFGYVMFVWPTIYRICGPTVPRTLLVSIAMLTAPWIYLAMVSAVLSYLGYWVLNTSQIPFWAGVVYLIVLIGLIGNILFGSWRVWPSIMAAPDEIVLIVWRAFYLRMATSMVVGLFALSVAILRISR